MKAKTIAIAAILCAVALSGCSSSGETVSSSQASSGTSSFVSDGTSAQTSEADESNTEASKSESSNSVSETSSSVSGSSESTAYDGNYEIDGIKLKTIGDAFKLKTEKNYPATLGNHYIYGIKTKTAVIRIVADMPEDVLKKYNDVDFFDKERDKKQNDIVKDLEITRLDDYTKEIPSQQELDKLIGKKGSDLAKEGYNSTGYGISGDSAVFSYSKGHISFDVEFNEKVNKTENFDAEKATKDLTVKSISYTGLAQSTLFDLLD